MTTGKISGLPCTTRTWLIVSLLKSLLFRQASRLRSLNRGHSVRFWCVQGGMKPCNTSASVADGHQRAAKCLPHGPGGSLTSPLSERDHTICLYRVRTVLRKKVNRSIVLTIDLLTGGSMSGKDESATKRSLSIVRPRGPSRGPGLHKLGCRDLDIWGQHAGALMNRIGQRWSCSARP